MKHVVQKHLAQSIAAMQATLADLHIADTIVTIAENTANAMQAGRKLLVAEFVVRLSANRPALRAVALTTDTSILTASGNDFGFESIFARQLEAIGQPGDVFLGISTSGSSPNILKALRIAREMDMITIGFSGNGGGQMLDLCDHNVVIPSDITMNIQECHLALEHIFCVAVERFYFAPTFDSNYQAELTSQS